MSIFGFKNIEDIIEAHIDQSTEELNIVIILCSRLESYSYDYFLYQPLPGRHHVHVPSSPPELQILFEPLL